MAVAHPHLVGARGDRTLDGGPHVARQPLARALVVASAGHHVVPMRHAGGAFHVDGNEHAHGHLQRVTIPGLGAYPFPVGTTASRSRTASRSPRRGAKPVKASRRDTSGTRRCGSSKPSPWTRSKGMNSRSPAAGLVQDEARQVEDRDLLARPDVDDEPFRGGRRGEGTNRAHGVVDVEEAAPLRPVAVDGQRAPLAGRGDEARQHHAVATGLPGAHDVEEAHDRHGEQAGPVQRHGVGLAGRLRQGVDVAPAGRARGRTGRPRRAVPRRSGRRPRCWRRRGRGVPRRAHASSTTAVPVDVAGPRPGGSRATTRVADRGREVEDEVGRRDGRPRPRRRSRTSATSERARRRHVLAAPRREVVERDDLVPGVAERPDAGGSRGSPHHR